MPAALNEMAWSFGITTYNAVYAHIGTNSIAAININATIEELFFVVFLGLGNACSIMVGNRIGAGQKDLSFEYGRRFTILSVIAAVVLGAVVIAVREPVIRLYDISPEAAHNVRMLMLFFGLSCWLRVQNFIIFIGALRAGGDTRYTMWTELLTIWLIGVPLALLGGFVLKLAVYWVYLLVLAEEVVKAVVIDLRFLSRKWIHDLVNLTGRVNPGDAIAVQWFESERRGHSHIPIVFWYLSIIGGGMTFIYACLKPDLVFMCAQALGLMIYVRNLMLIYRPRRRAQRLSGLPAL